MEEALSEHYITVKRWLAPYLRGQQGPPSNKARDKLVRLTPVQFQELSTDVYDELLRREDERAAGGPGAPGNNIPNHLLPKNNFHFKRNQARQKLSTLPTDRFRQLATDVFYELERRFPQFAGGPRPASPAGSMMSGYGGRGPPPPNRSMTPNGYGPPQGNFRPPPRNASLSSNPPDQFAAKPQPKTFQSNTIVPNKGTMVEDDGDDSDGRRETDPEQQAQVKALEDKVDELNKQLREKDEAHDGLMGSLRMQLKETEEALEDSKTRGAGADSAKADWDRVRSDLESKLARAEDFKVRLQNELDAIRRDKDSTESDLRRQIQTAQDEARRTPQQDPSLQRKYDALQSELARQQHVTDEVRREALGYLTEMRTMSEKSGGNLQREEQLAEQVTLMERELREWKARYARSKTQLRSLRASSAGLGLASPSTVAEVQTHSLSSPSGLIKDIHLTKFQMSVDELLTAARRHQPEQVIDAMKGVISNVRSITADIPGSDKKENSADSPVDTARKLKMRVSATANNLITACKNHAASLGLSPVSLVDAAASHLSTAVIELAKVVKVRPTPENELTEEEAALAPLSPGLNSRSKYGALTGGLRTHSSHISKSSVGSATFSLASSPRQRPDYLSSRTSDDSPSHTTSHGIVNKASPVGLGLGLGGLNGGSTPTTAISENHVSPSPISPGLHSPLPPSAGLESYKNYLEDQTARLVQNIQPLVNTIRSGGRNNVQVDGYVNEIGKAIADVVNKTQGTIASSGNRSLARHAPPVTDVLEDCRRALVMARAQGERERMPPVAFRIARATKVCSSTPIHMGAF